MIEYKTTGNIFDEDEDYEAIVNTVNCVWGNGTRYCTSV